MILLFFVQCNYKPIYSQSDQNFEIVNLKINSKNPIIKNRLEGFSDEKNAKYFYNLNIETSENKSIISKNIKGEAILLRKQIKINLNVSEKNQVIFSKVYSEDFDYQNLTNKFELSNYEDQITIDMYNKIASKILIDLSTLK